MTNEEAKTRLLELHKQDQKYRDRWELGKEIWKLQSEIDIKNMEELKGIVDAIGWPTIPRVGKEAAYTAILIAQHSRDIKTSVHFLSIAQELYNQDHKNVDGTKLTNWVDAVCLQRQKPQIYGQYLINRGDGNEIYDIEAPAELDKRRLSMGLEPFADHICDMIEKHPEDKESILRSYEKIFCHPL